MNHTDQHNEAAIGSCSSNVRGHEPVDAISPDLMFVRDRLKERGLDAEPTPELLRLLFEPSPSRSVLAGLALVREETTDPAPPPSPLATLAAGALLLLEPVWPNISCFESATANSPQGHARGRLENFAGVWILLAHACGVIAKFSVTDVLPEPLNSEQRIAAATVSVALGALGMSNDTRGHAATCNLHELLLDLWKMQCLPAGIRRSARAVARRLLEGSSREDVRTLVQDLTAHETDVLGVQPGGNDDEPPKGLEPIYEVEVDNNDKSLDELESVDPLELQDEALLEKAGLNVKLCPGPGTVVLVGPTPRKERFLAFTCDLETRARIVRSGVGRALAFLEQNRRKRSIDVDELRAISRAKDLTKILSVVSCEALSPLGFASVQSKKRRVALIDLPHIVMLNWQDAHRASTKSRNPKRDGAFPIS